MIILVFFVLFPNGIPSHDTIERVFAIVPGCYGNIDSNRKENSLEMVRLCTGIIDKSGKSVGRCEVLFFRQ